MPPKKKSIIAPVVYGFCLIFVLYLSLHGAAAFEKMQFMLSEGDINKSQQFGTFLKLFVDRLTVSPYLFRINQYTRSWIMYGALLWFIIVISIENSKKNFIRGKEFGTARWGTVSDIRDLFASTLEAKEIKKVKHMKTMIGR